MAHNKQAVFAATAAAALFLAGCASADGADPKRAIANGDAASGVVKAEPSKSGPYPSTYHALPSRPTLIRNAVVLDGAGKRIDDGAVLMQGGKVVAIGRNLDAPADAVVIDAKGKWVTPGIIDVHSHLGVYPSPGVRAHSDGNEITAPVTAEVWAEHSVWPQDPGFVRALAGGVTALQVLPGSANLIGGRGVTLKNVPSRTVQGMKFPDAPYGLKMACGENPKRVYGGKGRAPSTRMGNFAGYRASWIKAAAYKEKWDDYESKKASGKEAKAPSRDLEMDTLKGVLDGDILVHMHCYRADEMAQVIDMSKEFGYKVTAFHHAVEAYKIGDLLADNETCAAMWADWWGFKMEAYDGIRENIPFVHKAGACAIVHSDSDVGIQRLNQEAAKSLADAKKVGVDISKEVAWTWLSLNPARSLGIADQTGSLEPGKNADVVLWSGDPFSSYSKAEKVYVDGALVWDMTDPAHQPVMDFELGQPGEGDAK
ncbi:amidohydrolase [Iodidimonas muriae]|uniref:Amidohydrolase n=1 Tax=Iodidimonas muriae TaxID=261467 RepID=A0ABQ2LGQ7_9PROT|nr:amidohydrolase [Iodidimonas muriae]GER07452.1 amidohydrolase [Kordiimonadales bacterium JCM 17843]GGO14417.1 amidohydrolase [Iodidimonas muriae]